MASISGCNRNVTQLTHGGVISCRQVSCQVLSSLQVHGSVPDEAQAHALVAAAMRLLAGHVREPFHLTLLNIGATNFAPARMGPGHALPPAMARLLALGSAVQPPSVPTALGKYARHPTHRGFSYSCRSAPLIGVGKSGIGAKHAWAEECFACQP